MYDRFSDKGAHCVEWFEITKNFLILAFTGDRREAKYRAAALSESDKSDDEDPMDNMIADIGMEYDLGFGDQQLPLEVHNFYRLLAASEEKVHDGTKMTVLQVVTCLMGTKSKYNFSN
jgi:hypothetical protein